MRTLLLATLLFIAAFIVRAQIPELKLNRTFGLPIHEPYDMALDQENNLYVLDAEELDKFDPAGRLVETFNINVNDGYAAYRSLALDKSGNMIILNKKNSFVKKLDPRGKLISQFNIANPDQLYEEYPDELAIDEMGNVYVTYDGSEHLRKFNNKGEIISTIKLSEFYQGFQKPISVKVGKGGVVYILTENSQIVKLNNKGQLLESFKIKAPTGRELIGDDFNLALDTHENIYITNRFDLRVYKFSNSGQYLQSFGNDYLSFGLIYGWKLQVVVNPSGDVYVMDQLEGDPSTIQIFNSEGKLKQILGGFTFTKTIAQDYQNNICILAKLEPYIRIYNTDGILQSHFGTVGREAGNFFGSVTIKVDRNNIIYVLECTDNSARIQKFSKEGKFLAKYEDFGSFIGKKELLDLALDRQGNMYVTDYYGSSIRKLDPSGNFLKKMIPLGTGKGQIYFPRALAVDVKGNIYVSDFNGERIQKFDSEGRFIFETKSNINPDDLIYAPQHSSLAVDLAENIYSWNGSNKFMRRYDAKGKEIAIIENVTGDISINPNNTKILVPNGEYIKEYLTNYTANQNFITGKIYQDTNKNCQLDANEKPLPGIIITAEPGPYYGVSDEQGNYAIPVDTGSYTVKTLLPQDLGRTITPTCPDASNKQIIVTNYGTEVAGPNFGNQVSTSPVLNVEVASNRRRRCFRNTTTVSYANTGFAAAQNAKVMVQLPEFVHFISANAAYTRDNKGNYLFAVGALQPNQRGTITIIDSVSCHDPSIRGLTVCTKAWITPANTYTAAANWNKAEISVTGKMTPEGQARFVIQNKGQGNMTDSLAFRVFQDVDLVLKSKYKLVAGDSLVLRFTPTARVVRVDVDQPAGHPLKATASGNLEIKSKNAARAPEPLMMAYPPDDPEPEIAENCQPILDSFDPNDKQVIPVGITAYHYTPTNTPLRYTIRFQNTGNDVAYRVVIVDTLATDLDLSTLQIGAASHAYTLAISGKAQPILTFTFDNIMLPDSSTNQVGSNGFISFNIKPKANLPEKTEIKNYADIFFDYNEPVRTNTTVNRIYDIPRVVNVSKELNAQSVITTPTVYNFSPTQGRAGEVVTISGRNFSPNANTNTVTFNGVKATIISASTEKLTVRVPEKAFSGKIKIITPDGAATSPSDYIIFQPPTLTGISVNEGKPGQVITLIGNYFSPEAIMDTVLFDGVRAKVREASETRLQVEVPATAKLSKILIKTRGGQVESAQLFRIWYPPVITSFNPDKGKVDAILTLEGNNFAEEASRNQVQFAGIPGQVMQATATTIRVKIPVGANSSAIQVETPGGVTHSPPAFTFIPAPVISSFTPTVGNAGTVITINGQNFNTDNQADTVLINNLSAKILKISPTSLVVEAPKEVRSGTLTVAGAGGRASSSEFLVLDLTLEDAIIIYPNPAKDLITINWYKANFRAEICSIYNTVGKLVSTKNLKNIPNDELQLSISALPAGIYTVQFQTSAGIVVKRVVLL